MLYTQHHTHKVDIARWGVSAKRIDSCCRSLIVEIDMDHLTRLSGRIRHQVIMRRDPHSSLGSGEHRLDVIPSLLRLLYLKDLH